MSQLHLASEPYGSTEDVHLGAKDSFGTKLKEILGRIFFNPIQDGRRDGGDGGGAERPTPTSFF